MKTKTVNMLEGPIAKNLLAMTIPIMVMNVSQTLFNILDMWLLKILNFPEAVSASGACGTLSSLCTNLLVGLAAGANVIVANRIGKGQRDRADKAATTAILIGLVGGILLMIIGLIMSEQFLIWTNCPSEILPLATKYFRLYFLAVPPIMIYNFSYAILRSIGDTKRPMYYLIIGSVIKVISTFAIAKFFGDGVAAVGIALIITFIFAGGMTFARILKHSDILSINFKQFKFDPVELKAILLQGIPGGLQSSFYSFANTFITATVNSFGVAATTGVAIANQFDGLIYQIIRSPHLAVIPFISQNFGAKNYSRLRKILTSASLITAAFGLTVGILSGVFSRELSALLSDDPEVIAYSQQKMMLISPLYFICGINEIMAGVLKGMQKPISPAIIGLVFTCGLRFVWIYAIFPLFPTLTFLYAVWPIGWLISLVIQYVIYLKHLHKLEKAACV